MVRQNAHSVLFASYCGEVEAVNLYSRRAERMALEALADTRVVVVNGARQVGKSTLARLIVERSPGSRELYLDDPAVRSAAEADPGAFVRHDGLLLIDEIQRGARIVAGDQARGGS